MGLRLIGGDIYEYQGSSWEGWPTVGDRFDFQELEVGHYRNALKCVICLFIAF